MTKETIKINSDFIKLDSFLKFANVFSSGGESKSFIQEGQVLVNGEVCLMRGKKLYSGDEVTVFEKTFVVSKDDAR